ncbi:hypothetical protein NHX12_011368 [Muraenolepis orangiensis]|uniref:BTB domain-containing protein n=1 Tax=Muraenolepis orangiensis TaxID=630683 RepID=A0A9Q0I8Q7_9TELE|nr:hypothetical protein NHX12_011368 [Muraenolepis orangiensis]
MALPDSSIGVEVGFPEIIELNVGGQVYITRYSTLTSVQDSLLWDMFSRKSTKGLARDTKGRFFVDRDGFLFRYILDYMRDQQLVLPDHFPERGRLQREAEFFNLPELVKLLAPKISKQNSLGDEGCQSDPEDSSPGTDTGRHLGSLGAAAAACASLVPGGPDANKRSGFITIGYRGSYTLGRDSQTDAKFRRVARIMVCGKTALAKEVFGETLNESRDPDRPPERYTSRYYLKFTFLEQAFDKLADSGFHMVACNSTGTCAFAHEQTDDKTWTSYTEYVFYRGQPVHPRGGTSDPSLPIEGDNPPMPAAVCAPAGPKPENYSVRTQSLPEAGVAVKLDMPDTPGPVLLMESPQRPKTLNLRTLPRTSIKENGLLAGEGDEEKEENEEEERKTLEDDMKRCIEDFKKIRVPRVFPDRKRHWQSDLLKKYNA